MLIVPVAVYFYVAERNSWRPKTIELPGMNISDLTFSPDGRYLLVGDHCAPGASNLVLCNVVTRQRVDILADSGVLGFLSQGESIAICFYGPGIQRTIQILSFPSLQIVRQYPLYPEGIDQYISPVAIWPNDETLATQDTKKNIYLRNTRTNAVQRIKLPLPPLKNGTYTNQDLLPDNKTVVMQVIPDNNWKRRQFHFWDVASKKRRFIIDRAERASLSQSLPNGICLLWSEGGLELWDYHTGKQKYVFSSESSDMGALTLSSDGAMLASIDGDVDFGEGKTVILWDTRNGQKLRVLHGQRAAFHSLAFSPDGRTLACGKANGVVQLWRVK